MNAHDTHRAMPQQPLDDDFFTTPARRGPDDFVRIETGPRRVLGYLRPADGPNLAKHGQPEVLADPRTVRVNPATLDTINRTTSVTVATMPLYAVATGSAVSPLPSLTAARYMPLSTWTGELVRNEDADPTDLHVITLDPVN